MIRLLTGRARIGLVVAAMAMAVAMVAFAQTTEPAIESVPASDQPAALNSSPTGDENSTDKDTSVQSDPPVGPTPAAAAEVEIQRRFNELQRELLDDRGAYIDRWLAVITIALAFFGLVAVVGGYIGFKRFREIETDARNSTVVAAEHAQDAKRVVEEIEKTRDKADEIVRGMTAETAAGNPEEAKQAVLSVRENPRASLVDEAIANAISLQQQGKRDDAIERWRAVAHIAERSDDTLAATAWFSGGYLIQDENPEDALADYTEAIRLKPDYAEAYNNRGIVKAKLGRHDDALADYAAAIRLKPDHAEAYNNRGAVKAKLGRHDDALADYAEAIRLKPDHASPYYNLGIVKTKLGRYEDALADYAEAIRLKPDHAETYNNRGVAKAKLGRYEDALADYAEAIRLKPDYAEAYNNRAVAKTELGRYEDALADYAEAIRLKPDYAEAYNNRGAVKAKLGRHDDALADYAEAIRLKPDHAGAFYNRGVAKAKLGRYEDALADYAEAIRLKPDHAEAYNNRGVAKAELGRYEDALADYAEAIRLKPDLAEAYGNRGKAKNALGLKDEVDQLDDGTRSKR